nr:hypothetical protein [Tanacetum cinerariifolium]
MRTRSSSNLPVESPPNPSTSNPKRRNRRRSKQPFILEESLVDTMAEQRTMAELLRATTKGYAEAIVVPPILAKQFELKHSLINMMTSDQFFGLEKDNPHDHIRWFNKITFTIKYKDVPNLAIKLMLFPFSLAGAWDRYKDLLPACPHHGFIELHQLDTFYNALNTTDQDSLNSVAGGNLLERRTQDVLMTIENNSKVCNSRNKSIVSQVKSCDANSSSSEIAKLTHAVNQQTSAVTTTMTVIFKQFQATPPPAFVKGVEEIYVTCGGAHPYYPCLTAGGNTFPDIRDNIQGYVAAAAVNYNQGNFGYRPPGVANQIRPSGFAPPNVQNNQNRFSQPQGYNRGNNFNQDQSYQALTQQNQVVPLSLGHLPSNTIAYPKGELKSITTRSDIVLDGPFVPIPLPFINPEEDERVEETLTDQDHAEYTIKVPPSLVQKPKPPSQKTLLCIKGILFTSISLLHINITLADALILIPKYQKMFKALLSNKEKLLELANTPLNENCSAVILKKLHEKLGDPRKFLIPYGFSELKCQALANLGASINLMPLSVWKKLADFIIVDYESDPRVLLILERPFLRTARALIDVHGEEMILFKDDIFDPEGGNVLTEKLLDLDSTKDLHSPHNVNPLSGSTTFSSPNHLLEEFADELALITFPPGNNDLRFNIDSDLKEIEYFLNNDPIRDIDSILDDSIDQSNLVDLNDNLVDTMPEMLIEEHALDYSSPLLYIEYDDDHFEVESNTEYVYDNPFDSKGEKIKESKLLIDELDLPSDLLPSSKYDSFVFEDFSEVDALPLTNNEDKNEKKLAISHASLILEDFDPPLYEIPYFKRVLGAETLLSFSFENEEKVFKHGILTSKGVHSSLIPELSHQIARIEDDSDNAYVYWLGFKVLAMKVKQLVNDKDWEARNRSERKQEKDKIRSKPDKNGKRGEVGRSQK